VFWDFGEAPDIGGTFDVFAVEGVIEKGIHEYVLDNAKSQIVVPFGIRVNRPSRT
jgi:hypothetical protein